MSSNQAIGFFDSGWGGLSILLAAREALPSEDFYYIADCGYAPYGDQTHEYILDRARKITHFLLHVKKVKAVVIACNTATAEAAQTLREENPQNIIIGVEPAVKPATVQSVNHRIGVIATDRTIASMRYRQLLARYAQGCVVHSQGCPGLMECVENGELNSATTRQLLNKYLAPMRDDGVDTLVLGCTHYPFLSEAIRATMGYPVHLIQPGAAVSRHLKECLQEHKLLSDSTHHGFNRFYVSDLNEDRKAVAQRLYPCASQFEELPI